MDISNQYNKLQQIKFDLFKEQNPENGLFDVTFQVEGKLLYAHKTMLNLVSPTFASMLSDRWISNKDAPIKIEGYEYDDYFQFITYLYTGKCQLTDTNVFAMTDIAEFYGVNLFKDYCEQYLSAMEVTTENILKLIDLADKYSMIQLKTSIYRFIANEFQSFVNTDGFLNANKSFIEEAVISVKDKVKAEDLFQAIYKWCEKHAMAKQTTDANMNLNDTIRAEIAAFLLHISFDKMDMKFLLEFVASRGFIFSSYNELSKVLSERFSQQYLQSKVKITNSHGQTLHGTIIPDESVIKNIKSLNLSTCTNGYGTWCWWDTKCVLPSTPSPLKKKDDVEWYLIYTQFGNIAVEHVSEILEAYHLLAELMPGTSGFDTAIDCKIEIE